MLDVARSVPGATVPVEWREGSAQQLPFGDAEFDVVLCQHGLQFFPDRRQAVSEMKRVLRPGGRAAVLVLQELSRHPVFESVMGSLARRMGRPVSEFAVPFALADLEELEDTFEAFGTVDVRSVQIQAAFAQPERFVDLAVHSSATAVPAFGQLATGDRAALLGGVREDVQPVLAEFTDGDFVRFSMWGHLVIARD